MQNYWQYLNFMQNAELENLVSIFTCENNILQNWRIN